jgi:glutamate-1-semialdehyde 2,1-aminomutase
MAAGVAVLTRILTRDAYPKLHANAARLNEGCQEVIDDFSLPAYSVNVGPKGCVMFTPAVVTNYRDFVGLDSELWAASFFYLVNRGVLLPPGPDDQWTLSVAHTTDEIDRYIATFRDFAQELTA